MNADRFSSRSPWRRDIDAKVVTPDTTYTDTGAVNEAGYTIKNSDGKANGVQTMTQVLEKSFNTGAIFVEKLLGNLRFLEYVKNFGFGEKTGIDTIGEASGKYFRAEGTPEHKRLHGGFRTGDFHDAAPARERFRSDRQRGRADEAAFG